MRLYVRSEFRYSERVMRHLQPGTLQKLGIVPGRFAALKQWHAGYYYGSPGKDIRWLVAKAIAAS